MKYKGKYRLKANLDILTNDFPRNKDGNIDPTYDDIYIKCKQFPNISLWS